MKKIILLLILFSLAKFCWGDELQEAWSYFLRGRYNLSERIVDSLFKSGETSPKLYYLKGLLLEKRARFTEASKYFDELYFYGGKWAEYSLIGKADIYFLDVRFNEANKLYTVFLKRYPRSNLVPEVLYKCGLALRKEGKWQEAKENFKKLVKKYPNSISATYAREILAENEFFFTIQVGSFLNFDNAYDLSKKLASSGYNSYIKKVEHKDKLYYRVRVGKFDNREQVESVFKKLITQGYSGLIYP